MSGPQDSDCGLSPLLQEILLGHAAQIEAAYDKTNELQAAANVAWITIQCLVAILHLRGIINAYDFASMLRGDNAPNSVVTAKRRELADRIEEAMRKFPPAGLDAGGER